MATIEAKASAAATGKRQAGRAPAWGPLAEPPTRPSGPDRRIFDLPATSARPFLSPAIVEYLEHDLPTDTQNSG